MLSMYLLLICIICGFIYRDKMTEISYGFLYKVRAIKAECFYKKQYLVI